MTGQLTIAEAVQSPDRHWIAACDHHRRHPWLLAKIADHYRQIRDAAHADGRPVPTVSMRDVFGALRLDHHRHPVDDDGFALNNSLTAAYSRLLIEHHPDLAPMVATRTRRTEEHDDAA